MQSLRGHFLVASPHLPDSNFYRSVVLMVQHDEEGAFGLVLNRPSERTVQEIWSAIGETSCESKQLLLVGGPVAGPLLAVHSDRACSEAVILPGVHLATQKKHLDHLVTDAQHRFRIFSGYSGWSGGQLERELQVGGWLTIPATADEVFSEHEDLWNRVSRRIGLQILKPAIRTGRVPDDPSVN